MKSSTPPCTTITPPAPDSRKRLMQWALLFSLLLHGGAAIGVIIFSGFSSSGNHSPNFTIENIEFSPSITAPSQPLATPPEHHRTMTLPSPSPPAAPENPDTAPSAESPAPAVENVGKEGGLIATPLGLGMTHGYFSMLAEGKTLRDDVRAYYSEMVEKINREWWNSAALLKEPLREDGIFEIVIQRNGAIEEQRLLRSSGSGEADRKIAEIIRAASPLPPLPASYQLDQFRVPLKIKAPLSLFRIRN